MNPKSFRFTDKDIEILDEWKEFLGFRTNIEVIRYALRRLGTPAGQAVGKRGKGGGEGVDIIYD